MEDIASSTRNELGEQLSFALHGATNRVTRLHKPLLEPLGLTFPQYLAMLALLDEAPQTVGALGTRLDMDTGTITPLIKRLESAGMVTRVRDVNDQRRVLVDVTDRGRALAPELHGINNKIKAACRLDPQGLENLRQTLGDLAHPAEDPPPPRPAAGRSPSVATDGSTPKDGLT